MKAFLEIGAAVFSLVGVVIGVRGTYLLTKWTHPFGWWEFNWSIVVMFCRKILHRDDKNRRATHIAAALSKMHDEDKAESLHGLHWIFLGFILQTVGAVLAMCDAVLVNRLGESIAKAPH